MKIKIILLIIIQSELLLSQNSGIFKDQKLGFTLGYSNTIKSYPDLNQYLINKNYFPLNYNNEINTLNSVSFGIELMDVQKNFYCKIYLNKNLNILSKSQPSNSIIKYIGFNIDASKDMCKNEKWVVGPMFGLNISDFNLIAVSSSSTSVLSNSNLQESLFKEQTLFLKTGIDIKRFIPLPKYINYCLGLNCFYQFEMSDGSWKDIYGMKYDAFPTSNMSGFVVTINSTIYF